MKNKRLIVLLSVLVFITVLIVINSTIFTLQKINVNWLTTKNELQSVKDYEIVESIDMGQSIFLLNKNKIAEELEKEHPYLQVVSIETKFPNKIVVHSAERESLYAIEISHNEYAVLDEKGKVLKLSDSRIFEGVTLSPRPIMVAFNNLSLGVKDFVVGEQVSNKQVSGMLTSLSRSLRESRYSPITSKGVFKSINVVSTGEYNEVNMVTRSGMTLKIKKIEEYTTDKLLLALERYNYFHTSGVVDSTIEVWYNTELNMILADLL